MAIVSTGIGSRRIANELREAVMDATFGCRPMSGEEMEDVVREAMHYALMLQKEGKLGEPYGTATWRFLANALINAKVSQLTERAAFLRAAWRQCGRISARSRTV